MPTIELSIRFLRDLRQLKRSFKRVVAQVDLLVDQLERGERPGDLIPEVGHETYKVRLKNVDAQRGKSGGFRAIYYIEVDDVVILITIYSKTQIDNLGADVIRRYIDEIKNRSEAENQDKSDE